MALFRNVYRVESSRLKGWDYAQYGWYFVTVNTKDHACVFGEVENGNVHLSRVGEIVAE